jgi:hypothetical protein
MAAMFHLDLPRAFGAAIGFATRKPVGVAVP